ncbi:uncharacterized protein LOC115765824 [Drosophila novamexicana]|uniref:uncharacterized protein LOC115765824 n=1 Tax=Drosophila novamexicana TaxID=47314 RepID=UPI0011E5A724|nr:uncharacterized protein LOC115765824 [Drosophila novamexicana]
MANQKTLATTNQDAEQMCCCNCKRKLDPYQIFDDNVEDIAKSLSQIMLICGINTTKACNAKSIIKRAFIYHEKLRTRCPRSPPPGTHLHRDDMLQALRIKCEMESVEAMLTYSIIKRAFKAFFHGKPDRSISNPILDAMVILNQKAAWVHAAYKTARIFDNYKAAFFWAHKSYEKQINVVYRSLYDRMSARANPLTVPNCTCPKCRKLEVPGHPKPGEKPREKFKLADCADLPASCILCGLQVPKIDSSIKLKRPRPILNHELKLPRCSKCNSPMLICECNIDQLTGEQYGECGQDSYKVKWYRLEQELEATKKPASNTESTSYDDALEPEHDWHNHHCPIDCAHDVSSETSNVCHADDSNSSSSSSFNTCSDVGSDDVIEKLEKYLNKLWAEELAAKKNPHTYVPGTVFPPRPPCEPCKRD